MRWVFIKPLNHSTFYDPEIQEPLGLEYLAAALSKNGCIVLLLDSVLDRLDDHKLARRAAAFCPDAVGFSITTDSDLESVRAIYNECNMLKGERSPFWIAGGNYITTEPHNAERELPARIRLMKYESDLSILEIVKHWRSGALDALPRIINATPPDNLDELPFPSRPYHNIVKNFGWAFNVQASRGCCSACRYCASRGMRGANPAWRGRSPENIVRELVMLQHEYGARSINFVDEDFLGPPAGASVRANAIADGIMQNRLRIAFGIQVRPNSLSPRVIGKLHAAGLRYVFMGIESDNPDDFRRWGRSFCPDVWQRVADLQALDIEVNAGTLMFHPDCTYASIRSFATKLHQYGLLNYRTAVNRLDAMPGSYFYNKYIAEYKPPETNGSIALPFREPTIEQFFNTVFDVLSPLEIPSMQALCALPTIQTNRMFHTDDTSFRTLRAIASDCDRCVADCFFALLDMFENNNFNMQIISSLKASNQRHADRLAAMLNEL